MTDDNNDIETSPTPPKHPGGGVAPVAAKQFELARAEADRNRREKLVGKPV